MNVYVYILVMAVVTYLIRMLPLTLIRGKIENKFVRSFLHYVPYACLMAMTFPAVFHAMDHVFPAVAGAGVAVVLALKRRSLITVAVCASVTAAVVSLLYLI